MGLGLEACDEPRIARAFDFPELQIGKGVADLLISTRALRGIAKAHRDRLTLARDARVQDPLFPQKRADVGQVAVGGLVQRGFHVDLLEKMHAAAQIEPEEHGKRMDPGKRVRRRRKQVQGDDIALVLRIGVELRLKGVPRLELRVGITQARIHDASS